MNALNVIANAQTDSGQLVTTARFGPQVEGLQVDYLIAIPSGIFQFAAAVNFRRQLR